VRHLWSFKSLLSYGIWRRLYCSQTLIFREEKSCFDLRLHVVIHHNITIWNKNMNVVPVRLFQWLWKTQFWGQFERWDLPARIRLGTCSRFYVTHKRRYFNEHTKIPAYPNKYLKVLNFLSFFLILTSLCLLIVRVRANAVLGHTQWHTHTHTHTHTNGRDVDRPTAVTSTWQHATLTRDRHPWPRRDLNPQSQ